MYAAVHRQNALTLISEIVEESDFSDAGYNATYVSDVQSLITKSTLQQFFGKNFSTQDIEMLGEILNIQKKVLKILQLSAYCLRTALCMSQHKRSFYTI